MVQDLHSSHRVGHVSADEDEDDALMDIGNDEETGFGNHEHAGNLMSDEDGEEDAMQFESVANKMFQSESEVVPLPTLHKQQPQQDTSSSSNLSNAQNNSSQHLSTGMFFHYICTCLPSRHVFAVQQLAKS